MEGLEVTCFIAYDLDHLCILREALNTFRIALWNIDRIHAKNVNSTSEVVSAKSL